jgi:hypothetical protein
VLARFALSERHRIADPQVFSSTATLAGATKLNWAHLIFAVQDLRGKLQAAISAISNFTAS